MSPLFDLAIVPRPILRRAQRVYRHTLYRRRPRVAAFEGDAGTVLQCCIAYNPYGGYCVPLSARHRPAAQRIFDGQVWEPDTLAFLTSHATDGDIVHAGTFFGDFLPALSRACAPTARVWAFEPNSESYRCAQVTLGINGLQNVELLNAGLGERRGKLPMLVADPRGKALGGGSRIIAEPPDPTAARHSELVSVVTVDDVVPADRSVSLIQLDVEGFEQPALAGALETIRRCKPILVLETVPADEHWLAENIVSLGYRVAGKVHGNTIWRI